MRMGMLAVPLLAAAVWAQEPDAQVDALREEIVERYRERRGEAIPPDALEKALREVLALRAQVARQVADRYAAEAEKRAKVGTLREAKVVLQVRSGAGGGNPNRIDMVGDTTPYVDERVETPIEWKPTVDIHERSKAYFAGGYLPAGKAFVITKVTYRGSAAGDSNGHGEVVIRAGREVLYQVEDAAGEVSATWEGRVVIAPGEERTVQVEVANSSAVEATFEGTFEDVAPAAAGPAGGVAWDPQQGVSVRSTNGHVVVSQRQGVLWEGEGSSVSSKTVLDGAGRRELVITVDGNEVLRLQAPGK